MVISQNLAYPSPDTFIISMYGKNIQDILSYLDNFDNYNHLVTRIPNFLVLIREKFKYNFKNIYVFL